MMMQNDPTQGSALLTPPCERLAIVRNRKTLPDPFRDLEALDPSDVEDDEVIADPPHGDELHLAGCCRLGVAGYLAFAVVACSAPEPGETQGSAERIDPDPVAFGVRLHTAGVAGRASANSCQSTEPVDGLRSADPSLEGRDVAKRELAAARIALLRSATLRLEGLDADVAALRARLEQRMGPVDTAAIIAGLEAHSHVVRRYNAFDVARASAETMELVRHGVEARTEVFEVAILDADGS